MRRLLAVLLLLPALANCAERCPDAPPQPVFGGGSGVECRLLAARGGHADVTCFKRCSPPPREPAAAAAAEDEDAEGPSP